MRRFEPGESVVWRSVWRADRVVGTVWPWTVVSDSDDLIVLYRPVGTVGMQRSGTRGGPRRRMLVEWDGGYRELVWSGVNVLSLHRPGDMHSTWHTWNATTSRPVWRYVNLEEAWRRTPIGFDSKDLYLDLSCEPESDEWHWKDEDELPWLIEYGRLTDAQVTAIREEGERAIQRIRRREAPHDRDWDAWRPDPAWPIPTLPSDWKEYEPRSRC